jgi:hypothetical protein
VIKQGRNKKVEIFYERILKLSNRLQHQGMQQFVNHFLLNRTIAVSLDSDGGDEGGHLN